MFSTTNCESVLHHIFICVVSPPNLAEKKLIVAININQKRGKQRISKLRLHIHHNYDIKETWWNATKLLRFSLTHSIPINSSIKTLG